MEFELREISWRQIAVREPYQCHCKIVIQIFIVNNGVLRIEDSPQFEFAHRKQRIFAKDTHSNGLRVTGQCASTAYYRRSKEGVG